MAIRPCRHPGCPALVTTPGHSYCPKHGASVRRPCRARGCSELVGLDAQYCQAHQAKITAEADRARGTARSRGYDERWARVRDLVIARHPLCVRCELAGMIVPAEVVHHIRPISEGGARLDPDNLEPLCRPCHEREHGRKK